MITHKQTQLEVCQSDPGTGTTTKIITDPDPIMKRLEWELDCVTTNEQMRIKKEFSICLIEFDACRQIFGMQELWNNIEQRVMNFGYPIRHLVSDISSSIQEMGSRGNFTTDISEQPDFSNVNDLYQSTNKVNNNSQMLELNARCTDLDYMGETQLYPAQQGW